MRGPSSIGRRLVMCGGVAIVVGGTLLGASVVANAKAKPTPAITLALGPAGGYPVTKPFAAPLVEGTGFIPGTRPWVVECSVTTSGPAEPTMTAVVPLGKSTTNLTLPVGCSVPAETAKPVDKHGNLFPVSFLVVAGTIGPPAPGNDSSGASGATDAALYPCPPFASQAATNACEIAVFESNGQSATAPLTFVDQFTPNPTTTTTVPCAAFDGTVTAPSGTGTAGTGTATVDVPGGAAPSASSKPPFGATCVLGGQVVQVAATGLSVGNGGLATVIECNSEKNQPTIPYAGHPIPVSCTAITKTTLIGLTSNNLPTQNFTIVQGITGPPAAGTDSAGHDAAADAMNFPCPPTAAQVAAGDTCVIAVGTAYLSPPPDNSDQLPVPIAFNENALGQGTQTNNATKAGSSTTTAKKATTKAKSSSLAFTGAGPGLWWLGSLGVLLMVLGGLLLVAVEGPRRFLRLAVDHGRRTRGDQTG